MKRRSGWSLLIGLLVVIGVVGLVAAQQPKSGGTLRVAWEADISGLDPHLSFGMQAAHTYVQGYENLHGYKLRFETTWLDK